MVKIRQKLRLKDFLEFNMYVLRTKFLIPTIIVSVLICLLGIVLFNTSKGLCFSLIVVGVLAMPIMLFGTYYSMNVSTRKYFDKISSMTEEIVFDDDKILTTTFQDEKKIGFSEKKYGDIEKVVEREDCYYLYLSQQIVNIIRKDSIIECSVEELNNLLKQKFDCKKLILLKK